MPDKPSDKPQLVIVPDNVDSEQIPERVHDAEIPELHPETSDASARNKERTDLNDHIRRSREDIALTRDALVADKPLAFEAQHDVVIAYEEMRADLQKALSERARIKARLSPSERLLQNQYEDSELRTASLGIQFFFDDELTDLPGGQLLLRKNEIIDQQIEHLVQLHGSMASGSIDLKMFQDDEAEESDYWATKAAQALMAQRAKQEVAPSPSKQSFFRDWWERIKKKLRGSQDVSLQSTDARVESKYGDVSGYEKPKQSQNN